MSRNSHEKECFDVFEKKKIFGSSKQGPENDWWTRVKKSEEWRVSKWVPNTSHSEQKKNSSEVKSKKTKSKRERERDQWWESWITEIQTEILREGEGEGDIDTHTQHSAHSAKWSYSREWVAVVDPAC